MFLALIFGGAAGSKLLDGIIQSNVLQIIWLNLAAIGRGTSGDLAFKKITSVVKHKRPFRNHCSGRPNKNDGIV